MFFEKIVFVVFLLFCYVSFLLGLQYKTPLAYVPLVACAMSLIALMVVTLLQLQTIIQKKNMSTPGKWYIISWSLVHLCIIAILCVDGLEWTNILVVLCFYGILLTSVIFIVGTCACYVIIQNSRSWYVHMHLTCICFWVFVQFMILRTADSITEKTYMATIPILAMTIMRVAEDMEYGNMTKEIFLWVLCVCLHIVYETHGMTHRQFLWGTMVSVFLLCIKERRDIIMLLALPFVLIPFFLYVSLNCQKYEQSTQGLMKKYDELFGDQELILLPLEEEEDESDWSQKL
jgi:hypothetical protein